jgi:beta-N-acetylhexosaminidase
MREAIDELAQRAISSKVFPGCVIVIVRKGERIVLPYGTLAYNDESVREDTIYDCASITKSIPTASLVLTLVAEGTITLKDLARTWIPELRNDHAATIEDLLRYRVYGSPMSHIAHLSPRDIERYIFETGFVDVPGEERYSNLPAYLLGIIIERAAGKNIDALARDLFFKPLNMCNTFFPVQGFRYDPMMSVAPTETIETGDVHGIVHDESARAFAHCGSAVGHAGVFSNAIDLSHFAEALLSGSLPHIVRGAQMGLGWELNRGTFMGSHFGPRTFGKTGFTGTSFVCDTDRGVALIILSNRTYPTRPEDSHAINSFRAAIAEQILA